MNYIELSLEDVKKETYKLYKKIISKYNFDLVIFIAKGSFTIGKELAELNNVPLIEIYATRKGGKIKKILRPIIKLIPKKTLIKLRKKEMQSNYHEKNNDRNIWFDNNIFSKHKNKKNILLVDDSIDSGFSIIETKKNISEYFEKSEIKVAVLNVMAKAAIKPDFYLYKDTMISGPWSNDSKYHSKFIKEYENWRKMNEK